MKEIIKKACKDKTTQTTRPKQKFFHLSPFSNKIDSRKGNTHKRETTRQEKEGKKLKKRQNPGEENRSGAQHSRTLRREKARTEVLTVL